MLFTLPLAKLPVLPPIISCIGFVWPGFSSSEATGVASVRSSQKLPPCPTDNGSQLQDRPVMAQAEPISTGGSTSGIMDLRRRNNTCTTTVTERSRNV